MSELSESTHIPNKEERHWAMFAHLATFIGWVGIPFANIIAPLVIWQIKKVGMPFVSAQAKEALNFQILMTALSLLCIPIIFLLIGIPMLIALVIFNIVVTIIGAVKASEGVAYKYPFNIRLVR